MIGEQFVGRRSAYLLYGLLLCYYCAQHTFAVKSGRRRSTERDHPRSTKSSVASELGGFCHDDGVACGGVENAFCQENVCMCADSFVPFAKSLCIPIAHYLGDKCDTAHQCKHINPRAVCYKGYCICEPILYIAGRSCVEQTNEDHFGEYMSETSRPLTCLPKRWIGGDCCDSRQCWYQAPNSECSEGRCQCRSGYTNVSSFHCLPKAEFLGDACAVNPQCVDVVGAECHKNGLCWTDSDHVALFEISKDPRQSRRVIKGNRALRKRHLFEGPCRIGRQCTAWTRNSRCVDSVCQCVEGSFALDPRIDLCVPRVDQLSAGTCVFDRQCTVAGSCCDKTTRTCECLEADYCQQGALNSCLKKSGFNGACTETCQCSNHNGVCIDRNCICASGMVYDVTTQRCILRTLQLASRMYYFRDQFCCDDDLEVVGKVHLCSESAEQSIAYTLSDASGLFSIDNDGIIKVMTGTSLTESHMFTVTAQSTEDGAITDDAIVVVQPSECCTTAPVLLTNSITVTIGEFPDLTANLNAPMDDMGCGGLDEADANMRATNVNFANIFADRVVDVQLVQRTVASNSITEVVTATFDSDGDKFDPPIVRFVPFFQLPACDRQKLSQSRFAALQVEAESEAVCRLFDDGSLWLVPAFGGAIVDHTMLTCVVSGELVACNTMRTDFSLTFTLTYGDC